MLNAVQVTGNDGNWVGTRVGREIIITSEPFLRQKPSKFRLCAKSSESQKSGAVYPRRGDHVQRTCWSTFILLSLREKERETERF